MPKQQTKSKALQTVFDFCLQHALEAPVLQRVSLYRGLAEICIDAQESANLNTAADALENADRLCREFTFNATTPQVGPGN